MKQYGKRFVNKYVINKLHKENQFFVDKEQKFYKRGIMKSQERLQKVIKENGKYIIDKSSFFVF